MDQPAEQEAPPPRRGRVVGETVRRWLPRALFESFLIVFSVLLALWLSQWNERRATEQRVVEVRQFFAQELRANREMVRSQYYLPHHRRLRGGLEAVMSETVPMAGKRAAVEALYRNGIRFPAFRDAVWRSISGGEVLEHMKPEEVFMLADIYRMQDQLGHSGLAFYPTLLQTPGDLMDVDVAQGKALTLMLYMSDLVAGEEQLLPMYDRAIASLEGASASGRESPR